MSTPTVVQRQAEAADAIVQSIIGAQAAEHTPEPVTDPVASAPAPAPSPTPDSVWEQRYKTLQGIHQAEKRQIGQAQQALAEKVETLTAQLQELAAARTSAEPQTKPQMNPEDVERFGSDLVEMVQRGAAATIAATTKSFSDTVARLETRLGALEQAVTGVHKQTTETREEQFYTTLSKLVPDWENINASEEFLAWLAEVDPVYGVQRQVGLTAAHQSLRADHAANVFEAFKSSRKPKQDTSLMVAPRGTGGSPTPTAPTTPVVVTQREIQQFFHDVARGKYAGREAEAVRREAEINAAVAAGRVK